MKMSPDEYVRNVLLTENIDLEAIRTRMDDRAIRLLHAAMGLCTEAGEFLDQMKKYLIYGKPLDEINLIEELGDGNWYEGLAIDALETKFETIWERNIAKLRARYEGKFSEVKAENRNLEIERSVLESKTVVHYFEQGFKNTICNRLLLSVDQATDNTKFVTCEDCKKAMIAIHFDRMQ